MATNSPQVKVSEQNVVSARTQLWIKVVTQRPGLAVIERDARLYERHLLICTNEVVELEEDRSFFRQVANISNQPRIIKKEQ